MIHANIEVRPSLEVHSRDEGILKKIVGVQLSGLQSASSHRKLFATNYAPSDKRDSYFASVQVIYSGINWHGNARSYPRRLTRHPTDAELVLQKSTRFKKSAVKLARYRGKLYAASYAPSGRRGT